MRSASCSAVLEAVEGADTVTETSGFPEREEEENKEAEIVELAVVGVAWVKKEVLAGTRGGLGGRG